LLPSGRKACQLVSKTKVSGPLKPSLLIDNSIRHSRLRIQEQAFSAITGDYFIYVSCEQYNRQALKAFQILVRRQNVLLIDRIIGAEGIHLSLAELSHVAMKKWEGRPILY
jgi:hypothetical protein